MTEALEKAIAAMTARTCGTEIGGSNFHPQSVIAGALANLTELQTLIIWVCHCLDYLRRDDLVREMVLEFGKTAAMKGWGLEKDELRRYSALILAESLAPWVRDPHTKEARRIRLTDDDRAANFRVEEKEWKHRYRDRYNRLRAEFSAHEQQALQDFAAGLRAGHIDETRLTA